MRDKIKANLIKLSQSEEITNHAEADYEREPENAEYEATFDRAYENEFNMFIKVSKQLAAFIGISEHDARKMIQTKRAEIISILDMQ